MMKEESWALLFFFSGLAFGVFLMFRLYDDSLKTDVNAGFIQVDHKFYTVTELKKGK